jgi:hypothetical protein
MKALVTRDTQRPRYLIPRRLGGQLARLLIFDSKVIDLASDDDQ